MDISAIDYELRCLAEGGADYAAFNRRTIKTQQRVYGVRMPDLRRLARRLVRTGQMIPGDVTDYLQHLDRGVFEQVMLGGLFIGQLRCSDDVLMSLTRRYLLLVDSWAQIDCFVMKHQRFQTAKWWQFIGEQLQSQREFCVRYGVLMLMENYLGSNQLAATFARLRRVTHAGYYVKMAIAWLYAEAVVNDFEYTLAEVRSQHVDPWVRRKALQKMKESRRLAAPQQTIIAHERSIV